MNRTLSDSISFLRWPLAFLVVFIHVTRVREGAFESFFTQYVCAVAVPAFFVISGILFFKGLDAATDFRTLRSAYFSKLRRRIYSLLIPFLLWNLIAILFEMIPHLDVYEFTPLNLLAGFYDAHYSFVQSASHSPMNFPLWYIRDLMMCCLLSPLIFVIVRKTGVILPALILILWILRIKSPVTGFSTDSIAFFSLGGCFSIRRFDPASLSGKTCAWLSGIGIVIALILIFGNSLHPDWQMRIGSIFTFILVLLSFPFGAMIVKVLPGLTAMLAPYAHVPFFLYASHAIIIRHLSRFFYGWESLPSSLPFLLTVATTIIICVAGALLSKKTFPAMTGLLVGNK